MHLIMVASASTSNCRFILRLFIVDQSDIELLNLNEIVDYFGGARVGLSRPRIVSLGLGDFCYEYSLSYASAQSL
jgi:hypothetical protein